MKQIIWKTALIAGVSLAVPACSKSKAPETTPDTTATEAGATEGAPAEEATATEPAAAEDPCAGGEATDPCAAP